MDNDVNIKINASNETGQAFGELNKQLDDVKKSTASTTEKIAGLESQFKSLAVGGGLVFGALAYAGAELTKIGARSESVAFAFGRMTEQAGISTDALLASLTEASAGTIAETDLMLTANKAMALGVGEDIETMTVLMEVARLKGQNMGLTTTQAFNDIATGIGRGSPLILDNLGITIKLGEAQENYAKELGKTVATMTDAEKKQALLNAVLKQGREELAATGEVQLTASEQLQQMSATMDDLKSTIGEALAPAFIALGESIAGTLEKFAKFAAENPATVRAIFTLTTAIAGLAFALGSAGVAYIAFTAATAKATAALIPFGLTLGAVLLPLAGLVAVIGAATVAYSLISDSIKKSTDQIAQNGAAIASANAGWLDAKEGVTSYDSTLIQLNDTLISSQAQLAELGKKAGDVAGQMADAVKESEQKQEGYKMDKANAFIDQEQKIADIEEQLLAAKASVRDADREREKARDNQKDEEITRAQYKSIRQRTQQAQEEAQEKIATLNLQLEQEKVALDNAATLKTELSAELAEAARFNNLTEFEQKLETIAAQELAEQARLAKRLESLGTEAAAITAQQDAIKATIQETQAAIVDTEKAAAKERIAAAFAEAKAVINAEMQKAIVREQSTKKYTRALKDLTDQQIEANKSLDASDDTLARLRKESQQIGASVGTTGELGVFEGSTIGGTASTIGGWLQSLGDKVWGDTPSFSESARNYSVNDAIISPKGDIISTHPDDYIIATKTPETLGGKGGVVINISGTFLNDRQAASRMAKEIMQQLGNQQRVAGL